MDLKPISKSRQTAFAGGILKERVATPFLLATIFACTLLASRGDAIDERPMSKKTDSTTAEAEAYKPIPFSKRHRISVEDATEILAKHGEDRKSADKEARRIAV